MNTNLNNHMKDVQNFSTTSTQSRLNSSSFVCRWQVWGKCAVLIALLFTFGLGSMLGAVKEYSHTFSYSELGTTWSLTDWDDKGDFALCPDEGNESVATIPGVFSEMPISGDVVITLNVGTFGGGTNPTASTFSLYTETACSNSITASQGGTLPTSSTYTNVTYTIASANTGSLTGDLAVKISKPTGYKQIRLVSITVAFNYTVTATTITLSEAGANSSVSGSHYIGDEYTLPSSTEATCGTKKFVGWSKATIAETDTRPTSNFYGPGETVRLGASNTFYAVFATEGSSTSLTSTFTSKSWTDGSERWKSGGAGSSLDATRGIQLLGDVTAQATTAVSYDLVDSVIVKYATNSSSGAGTISIKVGNIDFTGDASVTKSGGATLRDINYTKSPAGKASGKVKIRVECTTNSIYIKSVKIVYAECSAYSTSCAPCDATPIVGAASLYGSFYLDGVGVKCASASAGTDCSLTEYGFVWSTSNTGTHPDASDNVVTNAGEYSTNYTNTLTPILPATQFTTGQTIYYRGYAKNNGDNYGYSSTVQSFTPYVVSYNPNGGTGSHSGQVVNTGGSVTLPAANVFSKTGYQITKWAMGSASGTQYDPSSTSPTISDNTTFYAVWTAKTYSITLDDEDATTSGSTSVTLTYNSSTHAAITNPTKTGYNFGGWYTGDGGTGTMVINSSGVLQANVDGYTGAGGVWTKDAECTLYALWTAKTYNDYKFSCAELTLTGPTGDIVFITSTTGQTVRSQEAFHIEGSALSPSQTLTFTISNPLVASKFAFKKADGSAVETDANGKIDTDFYIFYTPDDDGTSDGLDQFTNLTASVTSGNKKKSSAALSDKTIIGRHLPTDFVIAAKYENKWWALPGNINTLSNPAPVEIAVDNINNPSIAYTANTNIYNLYGQKSTSDGTGSGQLYTANGVTVKFGMKNNSNKALFASVTGNYTINGADVTITNNIGAAHWWTLVQTETSISNAKDAKYTIQSSNNTNPLRAWFPAGGAKWGVYPDEGAKCVSELRIIPASSIVFAETEIVEWGRHGAIIEVDATAATGIDATSVVAHLGANTSSATLTNAGTSGKPETTTKYNYIVDFGNDIDFATAASNGALLTLEWKKGEMVKAMSNIIVPKIIAATSTLSSHGATDGDWNSAEVHVLPGVTLTANAGDFTSNDVMIKHLEIYPGATVAVTKGEAGSGTLKVKMLVLRNGWTRVGSKKYDVARLYITPSTASLAKNAADDVWYSDWYIDFDQYYPIAVPWEVDLSANDGSKIWYKNTNADAIIGSKDSGGSVRLRYYDGASRATNVQAGVGDGVNWKHYGDVGAEAIPTKLVPGKGYAMTAKRPIGKAFSIIRMPLTIPNGWTTCGELGYVSSTHKDQVSVTAHNNEAGTTPQYAKGWNLIANPFMSLYQGPITHSVSDDYDIEYVSIPDTEFKEFGQYPIGADLTKLAPSSGFLIQAEADGVLTFGTTYRKASAPSYRNSEMKTASKQKAYIILSDEDAEDMMGILVSEKYTAEYELNADLEKLLSDGNTLRTYMRYNNLNMAYLAINEELAKELIPVAVRIPADGEYTFKMHEGSVVNELEGVYLTDYETGKVTNLLYNDYTFTAEAGTLSDRFAINAIVGVHTTPTSLDITGADKDGPTKFIYHDKVFILHNGVIYDSTGKRVNVINK